MLQAIRQWNIVRPRRGAFRHILNDSRNSRSEEKSRRRQTNSYTVNDKARRVIVARIGHRREIYRS
jgi:hypothetical protein